MDTTGIAVFIGLVMVNFLEPGASVKMIAEKIPVNVSDKEAIGITDILQSFVSPNLIHSMAQMEILPLIVFSLIFGELI